MYEEMWDPARSPATQQDREVAAADDAVHVQVRILVRASPRTQQGREVHAVNDAVTGDVAVGTRTAGTDGHEVIHRGLHPGTVYVTVDIRREPALWATFEFA